MDKINNHYLECPYCGFQNHVEEEYCYECSMRLLPYKNQCESNINTNIYKNHNTRINKKDKFSMKISTKILLGILGVMFFPYVFSAFLIFTIVCVIKKENPIDVIQDWFFERYQSKYYSSNDFLELRDRVCSYIEECNKLNEHISELKNTHIGIDQTDFGSSTHYDSSFHNYSRPEYSKKSQKNYVYNCSREICDNANKQPFKYV